MKLHDHNCGFKAYRREIFDEVELYGERHRFVPVLAAACGWKVGEIEVEHHAREFGRSKYGVSRLVKGFLDLLTIYLLTGFSSRPLHLIGAAGMFCFAAGGIGISYLSAMWVISRMSAANRRRASARDSDFLLLHSGLAARCAVSVGGAAGRVDRVTDARLTAPRTASRSELAAASTK